MYEIVYASFSLFMVLMGIAFAIWNMWYIMNLIIEILNDGGDGGHPAHEPAPEPLRVRALPARKTLAPVYTALRMTA